MSFSSLLSQFGVYLVKCCILVLSRMWILFDFLTIFYSTNKLKLWRTKFFLKVTFFLWKNQNKTASDKKSGQIMKICGVNPNFSGFDPLFNILSPNNMYYSWGSWLWNISQGLSPILLGPSHGLWCPKKLSGINSHSVCQVNKNESEKNKLKIDVGVKCRLWRCPNMLDLNRRGISQILKPLYVRPIFFNKVFCKCRQFRPM